MSHTSFPRRRCQRFHLKFGFWCFFGGCLNPLRNLFGCLASLGWSLVFGALVSPLRAAPVISEFLADSDGGLKDENGDDEDWIEIYNPDTNSVDLAGWRLTDELAKPSKWVFPSRVLPPGGRIVVWASEKDRTPASGNLHTNFKLDQDGEYLALLSPAGTVITAFTPVFPFQTKNTSFGTGFSGTVTVTDGTPSVMTGGTHYSRVKLTGVGTAAEDGTSLNVFDDSVAQPRHQQYLWFDYSSRLSALPAGQNVVEATLEWTGECRLFAGVSGANSVTTPVGIFIQPNDVTRGVTTIATGADGNDLVDFFAATTSYATVSIQQGETKSFVWNVTQLVKDWLVNPAAANFGKFIIVPGAHPTWIAWDQNRPGPKLTIRTQVSPTPVTALGFMTPTPGAANSGVTAAGPLLRQLTENPTPPAPAVAFPVTAHIVPFQGGAVATVSLTYRKHYDVETTVTMVDDGTNGDVAAADNIYTGLIPAAQLVAGQMIRWRVTATDGAGFQTKMPPFRDAIDSPQYFGSVCIDASISTNLMPMHRFIQTPASANTTAGTRCSVFLNGEFYDNVGINLHGQSTSGGSFLKKSYDIDGTRGYRFKWSMDPAQPRAKDINLLTIFADKSKVRHSLAYEMNREAGVAAHYCFPVHCRLNGVFDGLYDFVEDGDDVYLERAGLNKNGALYKMYNSMGNSTTDAVTGAEKKNRKNENNLDLYNFLLGMNLADANARKAFLFDNVDVPKMINMMAANTVTGNVDLHAKNYYVYCDSGRTNLWTLLPWDLDLSQGRLWTSINNYFDDGMYLNAGGTLSGQGQILIARFYGIAEFANMAKRRIRTLQDKFWKTSATAPDLTRWYDRRLNEMSTAVGASIVAGQSDTPGMDAALDYAKYPAALWKNAGVTTASPFAAYTMSQELQRLMATTAGGYVVQRINTINSDGNVPAAYNLNTITPLTFGVIERAPASGDPDQEYIEIINPNAALDIDLSGWQITGGVTYLFEPGTVVNRNNKIYVAASRNAFKTRTVAPKGGQSLNVVGGFTGHLTNLGETLNLLDNTGTQRATNTFVGSPTPQQEFLVVTEVMYNPGGNGLAEYVELMNISNSTTVSLIGPPTVPPTPPTTGVHFVNGFEFDFTGSAVTSLAPGQRVLVVRDAAAFQAAHGTALPVAGVFAIGGALSNGGETIKLEDPLNNAVSEFTYDDLPPWPAADGTGASMVLIRPDLKPDPSNPLNWRASIASGGNPGGTDALPFTGTASADNDHDGLTALVEYVLGTSDSSPGSIDLHPKRGTDATSGLPFLEITITRQQNADDATFAVESSTSLTGWSSAGWAVVSSTPGTGGAATEVWRLTGGDAASSRLYVHCRITQL